MRSYRGITWNYCGSATGSSRAAFHATPPRNDRNAGRRVNFLAAQPIPSREEFPGRAQKAVSREYKILNVRLSRGAVKLKPRGGGRSWAPGNPVFLFSNIFYSTAN